MAERKDRMALLSRYNKLHLQHYEAKSLLNLNVEQWAADGLIESYGLPFCYDLLEYFFEISQTPSWKYFANNADKIIDARDQYNQDLIERQQRRKKAKEWLSE
jgi:dissimilatory sulfite reductase (desulfoviridin) alpha/beta subunit